MHTAVHCRCPVVDLSALQALQELKELHVSLADPGWCKVQLQPEWPSSLTKLSFGSSVMEPCQLHSAGEVSALQRLPLLDAALRQTQLQPS